ncbi:bactericidal permeability-increasing protein-like [Clavelina lepadiformis]|uniref:bactericidal permeability-increasing protein-like n=1 Tax=Clavelina lepadiformis TaxID=159417 RepID=UPI004042EC60
MNILACVVISFLAPAINGQSQINVQLNQRGLDFVRNVSLATVEDQSKGFAFSDVTGTFSFQTGDVTSDQSLVGMTLDNLDFKDGTLKPFAPNILLLNASMVTAVIVGLYDYRLDFFGNTIREADGQFTADVDMELLVSVELLQVENQFLSQLKSCSVRAHSVQIRTESNQPSIDVNLAIGIQPSFTRRIEDEMCDSLAQNLNQQLNSFIRTAGLSYALTLGISVDLSLFSDPRADTTSLLVPFSGKCFPDGQRDIAYSYERRQLPDVQSSTAMGHMVVGDYVIRTFMHSLYLSNALNVEINLNDVGLPIRLDTTILSFFIPGLRSLGLGRPLRIGIVLAKPLDYRQSNEDLLVDGEIDMTFSVIENNGNIARAFVLNVTFSMSGNIVVNGTRFGANIGSLDFNIALKSSDIGNINIAPINQLLSSSLSGAFLPIFNEFFDFGIEIPSAFGFDFKDVEFQLHPNAVEFRGDIVGRQS